jgi:ankyrin repeat protein
MIRCLVAELDADHQEQSCSEAMPLLFAVRHGHLDVARCLVEELGFDVNEANAGGVMPLTAAFRSGNLEMAWCLVKELGADTATPTGKTLFLAAIM